MKRLALGLVCTIGALGVGGGQRTAAAQAPASSSGPTTSGSGEKAESEKTSGDTKGNESGDNPVSELTKSGVDAPAAAVDARATWSDIVVVPRKAFLKDGRVELAPFAGVSVNDVLIRHYAFGGDLNYFLTDVLSIGLQGQYYLKERTDREGLVGLQYNHAATLNQYKFGAALNFGYVPGYGKFTLFNKAIVHWEVLVSAGVGVIRSEIIPRTHGDAKFHTDNIAPNFGLGTRLFISRWLTFNFMFRDYVFNDHFEPLSRLPTQSIATVEKNADKRFVHNMMLYAGFGLYLPPSFKYNTPR